MARRGRPPRVDPAPPKSRPLVAQLERTALGLSTEEAAIRDHVQHLLQTLTAAAKAAATPPGIAVMAGCEFLALMLHWNIPPASREAELTRFTEYIRTRLKDLHGTPPPE